ncbi:SUMF1/EgtB/PvdO family nonheme iron enzyme [Sandaracinus amylolyticus]|uniref:SUMF1/EgtB/PvdO family nonheme iron enzyme n=1 Tax=Sandaracinus amylolyticus TaxID=927083 RepID=UPI001F482345|nr:SUMF1/EgtB/PvdO family nonheme iron enzyme [Sandaracinus amylolyticus]UJR79347.1 FGE-sulfatase domain-containing protein [Sandaracinus amylolyticus]
MAPAVARAALDPSSRRIASLARTLLVGSLTLAGCECGARTGVLIPDATYPDASFVDAAAAACGPEHPDVACVPGGAFELARYWWYGEQPAPSEIEPSPVAPAILPTFWLDRTEVTADAYEAAVRAGVVPAPPDDCGVRFVLGVDPDTGVVDSVPESSGWHAGVPGDARRDQPVVCVTREEAQAFCESEGGRLPLAPELMKAARGVGPAPRRFPWGDAAPTRDHGWALPDGGERWWIEHAIVGLWWGEPDPVRETRAVGAAPLGVSPYGALDLSGNVSEHLFDCVVDLETSYGRSTELVEITHPVWRAECPPSRGRPTLLVAGSNWASTTVGALSFGVIQLVRLPNEVHELSNVGASVPLQYPGLQFAGSFVPAEMPADPSDVPSEAARRSWFVGFRCAYDVAPASR